MQAVNSGHCLHIVLVIGKYTDIFKEDFMWWSEGLEGEILLGGSFHGGIFNGGREFSMKWDRVSLHYLKNDQKLNKITRFSH